MKQAILLLVAATLFLTLRLTNLALLPPYVDEGLHIHRALAVLEAGHPLIYTEGGKFLQVWLSVPAVAWSSDPLWAARLVTALAGLLSANGCYLLGRRLFGRGEVGGLAAWLYLVAPYALFLDRLVLNDGLLAMLALYIALFSLKVTQGEARWWPALGVSLGLAGLTKLNGIIFWAIPLLALVTQVGEARSSQVRCSWPITGAYLLGGVLLLPVLPFVSGQLSAPSAKTWLLDAEPSTTLPALWLGNLHKMWLYDATYLTWPILAAALVGAALALYRQPRVALFLLGAILLYNGFFILTAVFIFSRYLFPTIPLLLIFAGYGLWEVGNRLADKTGPAVLAVLVALPTLSFDYSLIAAPTRAPLEAGDRWLFIDGPLSGYGLTELTSFLQAETARHGPIVVARHDTPGLTREGLELTLRDWREPIKLATFNFTTIHPNDLTRRLREEARPVYVVLSLPLVSGSAPFTVVFGQTPYCHEAVRFFKPDHHNYIAVYTCDF